MKPEKLIICGWGPYKDETIIDFEKLNMSGLFLVTGQTGAGKTTIFDAIAYALYGIMSGGMREKGTVRSDFADADTKTYVQLYMRHKNQQYHILRNPEYLRPKKRKSGENAFTKEKENAVLTMPDGSIIAGNQDVTDKVKEILQMDGKQFCQISMIAQGEFAKLLFASSAEKNAIFRELFGTGVYEKVQSELKRRSAVLYDEYKQFKNKMEEDVRILSLQDEEWKSLTETEAMDFVRIKKWLHIRMEEERLREQHKKREEENAEKEVLSLQKELEALRQLNARFVELAGAVKRVDELEKKADAREEQKRNIVLARKARELKTQEQLLCAKERDMTELSEQIKINMTEVSDNKKKAEMLKKTVGHKEEIKIAFKIADQFAEQKELWNRTENALAEVRKKLQNARLNYERAQKLAHEKKHLYEQADVRYKKAVIGIAARLVKEGEPCPVCGSLEHPQVAPISENVPDEKQLEIWKQEAERAMENEKQMYERAVFLVNEENGYIGKIEEVRAELADLEEKIQEADREVIAYVQSHTEKEFEKECSEYLELDTLIVERVRQLSQSEILLQEKQKEFEEENSLFEKKVRQSGFEDRLAFERSVLSDDSLEQLEQEYEDAQREYVAAKEVKEHLEQALQGLEPADESALRERFVEKQRIRDYCRSEAEESRLLIKQMEHSLNGLEKNGKQVEKIQEEYGVVKDLDDLANGNNAKRLVFEQFVLAGYFEKILRAANLRLTKMTDGRYELLRSRQVSDGRRKDNLEIMVMDYYTGRQRSVKTLSGGETFKASLALALGMSDCIQAENGGMEVETLFIDEGFGALDEESLEQACDTLMMLAGRNRMVGIISHVAQLRERIENQIIVEKHNNGSRAKVI